MDVSISGIYDGSYYDTKPPIPPDLHIVRTFGAMMHNLRKKNCSPFIQKISPILRDRAFYYSS